MNKENLIADIHFLEDSINDSFNIIAANSHKIASDKELIEKMNVLVALIEELNL